MDSSATVFELKQQGAGKPASPEIVLLFRQAFQEFGTRALWNWRTDIERPTITQALGVAEALRAEGNLKARHLAVAIEQACRAAL